MKIALICLTVVICGCHYRQNTNANSGANSNAVAASIPSDLIITLERKPTLGILPMYKIIVFADGTVIYDGRKYVKTEGIVRTKISLEQVRELIEEFEKVDYFSLKDRYEIVSDGCPGYATDSPWAFTSITINQKSKSIQHYYGCQYVVHDSGHVPSLIEEVYPKELVTLESRIDEIVNTKQWVQ
jgi:hypothetical protein